MEDKKQDIINCISKIDNEDLIDYLADFVREMVEKYD